MSPITQYLPYNNIFNEPIEYQFSSFTDILDQWASIQPDQLAVEFLNKRNNQQSLTYFELRTKAIKIANFLVCTLPANSHVAIIIEEGIDYLSSFFGCLYADMVAVSICGVNVKTNIKTSIQAKHFNAVIGTESFLSTSAIHWPKHIHVFSVKHLLAANIPAQVLPKLATDDIAYLQINNNTNVTTNYTHKHLITNCDLLRSSMRLHEESVYVSILPLISDGHIIATALSSLFNGTACYIISAEYFRQDPSIWFKVISYYKATVTAACGESYELVCQHKLNSINNLNLSSLEVILNFDDILTYRSALCFFNKFSANKLPSISKRSCYGLFSDINILKQVKRFDLSALEAGKVVETANGQRILSSCGPIHKKFFSDIKIVDPFKYKEVDGLDVGEIWVDSTSHGASYWKHLEISKLPNNDICYSRTGDLGFIHNGHLFVCDRIKDLLFIKGKNIYPYDICCAVGSSHVLLKDKAISAFSIEAETREFLIVAISHSGSIEGLEEVTDAIQEKIFVNFTINVSGVLFINDKYLYKSTSGNIQHSQLKKALLKDMLPYRSCYLDDELSNYLSALHYHDIEAANPKDQLELISSYSIEITMSEWLANLITWEGKLNLELNLKQLGLSSQKVDELLEKIHAIYGINLNDEDFNQTDAPSLKLLITEIKRRFKSRLGMIENNVNHVV